MSEIRKHLLFYDGECGLCDRMVNFVLKADQRKVFLFAPLQGKTAELELKNLPPEKKDIDSLILIENYGTEQAEITTHGKGALRVLWLLGGCWKLIGWKSFLPSGFFDALYRFVAKNRHRFFSKESCRLLKSSERERFLP
jgi:predicted DCC family thiol-disulfide oxidoreductase YuxK